MREGGLDAFGRRVARLRREGVPDWLGPEPPPAGGDQ